MIRSPASLKLGLDEGLLIFQELLNRIIVIEMRLRRDPLLERWSISPRPELANSRSSGRY